MMFRSVLKGGAILLAGALLAIGIIAAFSSTPQFKLPDSGPISVPARPALETHQADEPAAEANFKFAP